MRSRNRRFARAFTIGAGGTLAIGLGLACLQWSLGKPFARISYDQPFVWRGPTTTSDIVLVYLDEESAKELHQPIDDVWNRSLHTALLERLTTDGARLVFYDLVFDTPNADPGQDELFEAALQKFGHAVIGASFDFGVTQETTRIIDYSGERVVPPLKSLRKAAAGWGLLVFKPLDSDYAVRQMFFGTNNIPSATWKAAELLGAPLEHDKAGARHNAMDQLLRPERYLSVVWILPRLGPGTIIAGIFQEQDCNDRRTYQPWLFGRWPGRISNTMDRWRKGA